MCVLASCHQALQSCVEFRAPVRLYRSMLVGEGRYGMCRVLHEKEWRMKELILRIYTRRGKKERNLVSGIICTLCFALHALPEQIHLLLVC